MQLVKDERTSSYTYLGAYAKFFLGGGEKYAKLSLHPLEGIVRGK